MPPFSLLLPLLAAIAATTSACVPLSAGWPPWSPAPAAMTIDEPPLRGFQTPGVYLSTPSLHPERADEIRRRLQSIERRILSAYGDLLKEDAFASGSIIVRAGINSEGRFVEASAVRNEVLPREFGEWIVEKIATEQIGPGEEAWVDLSFAFHPEPLTVERMAAASDTGPARLRVWIRNRATLTIPRARIEVTTYSTDRAASLASATHEAEGPFPPGELRRVTVPLEPREAGPGHSWIIRALPAFP